MHEAVLKRKLTEGRADEHATDDRGQRGTQTEDGDEGDEGEQHGEGDHGDVDELRCAARRLLTANAEYRRFLAASGTAAEAADAGGAADCARAP